ncbi:unnamed protein product [Adineta ricciae]|uniref:AIG1-type G domain-containing protein n=1 Tax=Adineta ricciae TaxID=249248 RepID=A0A814XGQ9_ADIRI|nr:unnamed protein product [Adineta ricciae]CAF1456406.1 unnamed protein product [Adineta ricciae]
MCAQRTTPSISTSKHGLILLGNSGVGKSFIGNVVLGRDVFEHECSSSSVTHETEFEDYTVGNSSYAVFNIPGLIEADQEAVDRNKAEIYKAFQQRPNSVIAFVFTGGSGGRIRDEDVIAFKAIHAAYNFQSDSLLLIVNDLPLNRSPKYEGATAIKLQGLVNIPNVRICFLDRISQTELRSNETKGEKKHGLDKLEQKLAGAKSFLKQYSASIEKRAPGLGKMLQTIPQQTEREKMRQKLIEAIIQCTPHPHEKQAEIQLTVDELKNLTEESKKMQQAMEQELLKRQTDIDEQQKKFDQLKQELDAKPREIHHYHEKIVERSGGGICTIS